MSKRLQVIFDDAELADVREAARRQGLPVSEWVRRSLRDARRNDPGGSLETKLRAVRAAMGHDFPTADIDQMLAEVSQARPPVLPE